MLRGVAGPGLAWVVARNASGGSGSRRGRRCFLRGIYPGVEKLGGRSSGCGHGACYGRGVFRPGRSGVCRPPSAAVGMGGWCPGSRPAATPSLAETCGSVAEPSPCVYGSCGASSVSGVWWAGCRCVASGGALRGGNAVHRLGVSGVLPSPSSRSPRSPRSGGQVPQPAERRSGGGGGTGRGRRRVLQTARSRRVSRAHLSRGRPRDPPAPLLAGRLRLDRPCCWLHYRDGSVGAGVDSRMRKRAG